MGPLLLGVPASERTRMVEAELESSRGEQWRCRIGEWITQYVPVESYVPENKEWRPLVRDAFRFVFSQLSSARLAAKIVEQVELPSETPVEARLLRLISRMPGLQKIGQVLARNRRIPPLLRTALIKLENGMSDTSVGEVRAQVHAALGPLLRKYSVKLAPALLSEASVSAVIRFTWKNQDRERERGVFKVMKPFVPECFSEDMRLLQSLGDHLAGYGEAAREVDESLTEVRMLLEGELDFRREQETLGEVLRTYRSTLGLRVPRVIPTLCTDHITAMSEESGVKVTDAARRSAVRQSRIAEQLIEGLVAVPLFSGREPAVFHADPHAGNLFYDEPNRELIVLDWALAGRLSRELRRQLILLCVMTILQNREGVCKAIEGLVDGNQPRAFGAEVIPQTVTRFFDALPAGHAPDVLDAMRLLDEIALCGVRIPAPLFLFRKSLFTLDGVLQDVSDSAVRMDSVISRHFLTRWIASLGLIYSPLHMSDLIDVEWNGLLCPVRSWQRRILGPGAGA